MSDSVQPHRWQPTRLPHPWDSPGKSTGEGCHFLLKCMKVKSLSCVRLFETPWIAVHQASLSITNSWSLLRLMSIESVMPSNHLILCHPLLLPPSIFPSISGFPNESVPCIRWLKYWGFSFGIRAFRMDSLDLLAVQGLSRVFSNTTIQKHQFFSSQLSLWSNSHIHT